jgi:hypothetical protein
VSNEKCEWCDQPGQFLCDFALGFEEVITRGRRWHKPITCDRRFCAAHRHVVSRGLACTRGPRGQGGGCVPFSVDYCPAHAPRKEPDPCP